LGRDSPREGRKRQGEPKEWKVNKGGLEGEGLPPVSDPPLKKQKKGGQEKPEVAGAGERTQVPQTTREPPGTSNPSEYRNRLAPDFANPNHTFLRS
jgi:hypothetical protein